MIFYFSGTGNSLGVARQLSRLLGERLYAVSDALQERREFQLAEGECVGLVFPVYAWMPPALVLQLMDSVKFSRKPDYLFFVCTCGDDTGKTAEVFCRSVRKRGWDCRAGFSVTMPNTYVCLPGFDTDSDEVVIRKLKRAAERVKQIASDVRERKSIFDCHEGAMPWSKTYLLGWIFQRFLMSPSGFHSTSECISCGKCEKVCPVHNIRMEAGRPVWGKECTMCLSCYHHCPSHAVAYGRQTRNKGQYLYRELADEDKSL